MRFRDLGARGCCNMQAELVAVSLRRWCSREGAMRRRMTALPVDVQPALLRAWEVRGREAEERNERVAWGGVPARPRPSTRKRRRFGEKRGCAAVCRVPCAVAFPPFLAS